METKNTSHLNLSKFCQMNVSRFLARRVPFRCSQMYLAFLGKFYYLTHSRERELIRQTIRQVFDGHLKEPALQKLCRQTFAGILTHYQEKLFLAYAPETKVKRYLTRRLKLHGTEALQDALNFGQGVILVTGHFGAVEFLPGAMGLNGFPAAIIVRPQTKELAASLAERAALINLTLIIPQDGRVLPTALRALREGRILITEVDEFEMWRRHDSQTVSFLGFDLPADRTLEVLQKRSGAPLLTAFVRREPKRRYTVDISAAPTPAPGYGASSQCLQLLEKAIHQNPEQWYQWKEFGKVISAPPAQPANMAARPFVFRPATVNGLVPA
jgi:Kdo2-lipid IVA lauroyltransferase/acyltransferase